MLKKDFDLSVCVPVWYKADLSVFEKCLDSVYTSVKNASNKYDTQKIKIIIGIDNIPKDYNGKNNIKELEIRINILKDALSNLKNDNNIKLEYFITEFNMRVSVMRNIMISKSIDSKYITFIDADDRLREDGVSIMLENISKAYKKNIKVLYFKTFLEEINKERFESVGPWANLYNTSFLLEHNICFIPKIPMEDRFFRREIELYSIEEEQNNVYQTTYIHTKENRTGFIEPKAKEIVRQESFKRLYYSKLKVKTYSSIKRGFDEMFYKETSFFIDFEDISDDKIDNFIFELFNEDKHILKNQLKNFKFQNGKSLFEYEIENHFTLCNVINNNGEKETFCRGYLTDGSIKIDNIDGFNKIIESLELDSIKLIKLLPYFLKNKTEITANNIIEKLTKIRDEEILLSIQNKKYDKLLNILKSDRDIDLQIIDAKKLDEKSLNIIENYAFDQAYTAIIKEDIEKLEFLLNKFPNIINLKNEYNINLANISTRKQSIEDDLPSSIKSRVIDDKNKIIALLFSKSPESFKMVDTYNKSAILFILREYTFNLTTNNKDLSEESINNFLDITQKLLNSFGDEAYKLVQLFRYIYYELENKSNKKATDILLNIKKGKKLNSNEQKELLEELYLIRAKYNTEIFINENINVALNKKDYNKIKDILMIREESVRKRFGSQTDQDKVEIIYIKFSKLETILNYKDEKGKSLLDYMKEDSKLKAIIKAFLKETIWLNIANPKINIEPLSLKIILRTKTALNILYDKKYNFKEKEISFNEFLNKYFEKSNILKSAKIAIAYSNNMENVKKNISKNVLKKLEKVNEGKEEGIKEMKELIDSIELIKSKQDTDLNKINELLNTFEDFARSKKTLKK